MNVEPNRFFHHRNRLRVTAPPGGRTNDIFNTSSNESTPSNSPQKNKNMIKSQIFYNDDEVDANGNVKRSMSPRHLENTKDKLFGTPESSPRRTVITDTYRSNVFVEHGNDINKINSPKKKTIIVNPITGDLFKACQNDVGEVQNGKTNGCQHENGDCNGSTSTNDN